jgi:hypothetical protein
VEPDFHGKFENNGYLTTRVSKTGVKEERKYLQRGFAKEVGERSRWTVGEIAYGAISLSFQPRIGAFWRFLIN